jgi:hypothetical protein
VLRSGSIVRRACSSSLLPLVLAGCSDVVVGTFSGTEGSASTTGAPVGTGGASDATGRTTGTGPASDEGSSGSGGFVPPGCFDDDFDDGVVVGPQWNSWVEADAALAEQGGLLQLTPPTTGLFDTGIVGHFDYQFTFTGFVRMEIGTPPDPARPVGLFVAVGNDAESVLLSVGSGSVTLKGAIGETPLYQESFPMAPYPRWLGIRSDGTTATFEVSDDGVQWTTLGAHDELGLLEDAAALVMVQTYGDAPTQAPVTVERIEVCVQ